MERPQQRLRALRRGSAPYLFLLPGLVLMVFSTLIAIGYTVYISFTNYSLYHFTSFNWIGIDNYKSIFSTLDASTFARTLVWTIVYSIITTLVAFAVGLALALLLNDSDLRERNVYRTLLIIPWALPAAVTILAWSGILNTDFGYANHFLHSFFGVSPVPWLTDATWARISVIGVSVWAGYPFMMTACLGALQSVPDDLVEAARIDGARRFNIFRFVTFPVLRSVVVPLIISTYSFNFTNNFNMIFLLTGGGPAVVNSQAGATDSVLSYSYKLTLTYQRYGIACAVAVTVFAIVGATWLIQAMATGAFKDSVR
jgi:arabinogalactan oligomer/maltooligosaccharide transport system permease protein